MINIIDKKVKRIIGIIIAAFIALILGVVVVMDAQSTAAQQQLLEESIENQLMSITVAARDLLDADAIARYDGPEDIDDEYLAQRQKLRDLAGETGADYIYVLKIIDGQVEFVMDTDEADESVFIPYDVAPVHEDAFSGKDSVGVMNVTDEYGSYNTAAVPVWVDGDVVAVVSTDIEDYYLKESNQRATRNQIILISVMAIVLFALAGFIIFLLTRVAAMQRQLSDMARRDTVTGLPNRQYLIEYLQEKIQNAKQAPYALFFIDLDNFKKVNDTAGHDAGDELLRRIVDFLNTDTTKSKAFRPAPGRLNVAARIGGDEFVQVIDDIQNEEQAGQVAQKLLKDFSSGEFTHYENEYGLGLSIGVALYPRF